MRYDNGSVSYTTETSGLRPVFTIKPDARIVSGDGTIGQPYRFYNP